MSDAKSTKVLKKEDVEKGMDGLMVELPYVTIQLPNDTKTSISEICHSSNKELFLSRSIVVKNHVEKDLGLYDIAEELVKEMEESQCQMFKGGDGNMVSMMESRRDDDAIQQRRTIACKRLFSNYEGS